MATKKELYISIGESQGALRLFDHDDFLNLNIDPTHRDAQETLMAICDGGIWLQAALVLIDSPRIRANRENRTLLKKFLEKLIISNPHAVIFELLSDGYKTYRPQFKTHAVALDDPSFLTLTGTVLTFPSLQQRLHTLRYYHQHHDQLPALRLDRNRENADNILAEHIDDPVFIELVQTSGYSVSQFRSLYNRLDGNQRAQLMHECVSAYPTFRDKPKKRARVALDLRYWIDIAEKQAAENEKQV